MNEVKIFETIFEIIPFGVTVVDVNTFELVYLNEFARKMFQDETGEIYLNHLSENLPDSPECNRKTLVDENNKPNNNQITYEIFNEVDERWYQCHSKALSWPDGRIVIYSIFVDITNLKQTQNNLAEAHAMLALKNKELEITAETDRLTGLFNRLKLDFVLNSSFRYCKRYGRPLSAVLVDIDKFKSVNDTFGHLVGDIVLKEIATIIGLNVREIDTPGRWGGEEFLIICPETDSCQAFTVAEKLRKIIEEHDFPSAGKVTCSFGISEYKNYDTVDDIIKRADEALYDVKRSGRNRVQIN